MPSLMARLPWPLRIWGLYALGLTPAVWYFWLGATGQLPGNAVKTFEHLLGDWALRFLLGALAVTPLRERFGLNLVRYRRALGLLGFWYALMHFSTYLVLDQRLDLAAVLADIARRPFITIGMACLALLVPLALTSNAFAIRRLGRKWRQLHMLSYVIVPAAALHHVMAVKVVTVEPAIHLVLAGVLVAYRVPRLAAIGR